MPASNIVSLNFVPTQSGISTGTLGTAAGRVIFTNGGLPANIVGLTYVYTATATAGNRVPFTQISDASGNDLLRVGLVTTIAASVVATISMGPGLPSANPGGGFVAPLPNIAYLPPFGTVKVFDGANIDVADSISSGQILYLQG